MQVCLVTIYKGEIDEANKLMAEVLRFELDLKQGKLTAEGFEGKNEFEVPSSIVWSEDTDTVVIN